MKKLKIIDELKWVLGWSCLCLLMLFAGTLIFISQG